MACSKLKTTIDFANQYNLVSFSFKFSRSANLSLKRVRFENDVPTLHFEPAQNVPALTEEDVAIIVKLVLQNKRPGFFYEGFHPFHPFHDSGRLFKGYSPRWLRGTSVGELLAEVDWIMKCLHVGVRSDKEKKHFWAWKKTSNLRGLRTREDFKEDRPGATIIMQCESVDIDEEKDQLYFVGEPKMRIDCVRDGCNLDYSKYITEIFDNVAYHDEPLFLKMKEIVKLIAAIEWLKKKLDERGMAFNQVWADGHVEKREKHSMERIEVTVPPNEAQRLLNKTVKDQGNQQVVLPGASRLTKKVDKTGFQVSQTARIPLLDTHGCVTLRGTFNDYDYLLQGLDPNQPTGRIDKETGKPLRPNVRSWNELYSQTVPQPCTAMYTKNGSIGPPITGGVSTSSFTTNHVKCEPKAHTRDEVVVRHGSNSRLRYQDTPKPQPMFVPTSDVGVKTASSELRDGFMEAGVKNGAGLCDAKSLSIFTENGKLLAKQKKLETHVQTLIGNEVGQLSSFSSDDTVTELRRDGKKGIKIKLCNHLLPERMC